MVKHFIFLSFSAARQSCSCSRAGPFTGSLTMLWWGQVEGRVPPCSVGLAWRRLNSVIVRMAPECHMRPLDVALLVLIPSCSPLSGALWPDWLWHRGQYCQGCQLILQVLLISYHSVVVTRYGPLSTVEVWLFTLTCWTAVFKVAVMPSDDCFISTVWCH